MSAIDEEADLLAAELAFGLLDPAAQAEAETRVDRDPAFAAAVEQWRGHALGLAGAGESPPADLWARIAAALPANDAGTRRSWRWLGALGVIAAAMSGVALLRPTRAPLPGAAPHPLVALLTSPDRHAALAVSIAPERGGLATDLVGLDLGPRAAELWVIPAGAAPRSLGVVKAGAGWRVIPAALAAALRPGATLAVSAEPAGGSPTGKPTGPVVLSTTISAT